MRFLVTEKLGPHKFKTPEGYLICTDAILSRTGKQEYKRHELFGDACEDADKIVNVERTDDEVFSDKAMASFENKAVCIEHPDHDVNVENHNELSVGFVRDIHKGEDNGKPVMMGTLVITDKDAVEAVESGEYKELSCGYDCDIDDDDEPRQRNIRGNHVALCKQGRAGIARIVDAYTLDMTRNMEQLAENTYAKLKAEYDALDAEIDRNDNNPNYNLASASNRLQKIFMEITDMRKKFPFLTDNMSPENITIEVKDSTPVKVDKVAYKQGSYSILEATSQHGKIYIVANNYNGENPYSGGGTVTFTINEAKRTIESYETIDKLNSKYGKAEGYRRWMAGKKDAIEDDATVETYRKAYIKRMGSAEIYTITYKKNGLNRAAGKMFESIAAAKKYIDKVIVNVQDSTVADSKEKLFTVDASNEEWTVVEEENYKKANKPVDAKDAVKFVIGQTYSITVDNGFEKETRHHLTIVNENNEYIQVKDGRGQSYLIPKNKIVSAIKDAVKDSIYTIDYEQDGVTYVRKVRANSIEDAISKVKDDIHKDANVAQLNKQEEKLAILLGKITDYIKANGPLTAKELATHFRMSTSDMQSHLSQLCTNIGGVKQIRAGKDVKYIADSTKE